MSVSLIVLELKHKGVLVKGDCTMEGFEGLISVDSFSWSLEAKTVEKVKGQPYTTTEAKTLSFKKTYDRSSTALCKILETDDGKDNLEATLKFIDPSTQGKSTTGAGKTFDAVLEIQLVDVHLESIGLRASDSGKSVEVSEDVSLSFRESITLNYRSYDAKSRARNKPITSIIKPTGAEKT